MSEQCFALYFVKFGKDALRAVRRNPDDLMQLAATEQRAEAESLTAALARETDPFWIELFAKDPVIARLEWTPAGDIQIAKASNHAEWQIKPYEV